MRAANNEGKYKKAEKYYDSIFEGVETESLPLPDRNGEIPERGYLSKEMDTRESVVLSACEKLGVTPNILFTGLFGVLMTRYSNSEDSLLPPSITVEMTPDLRILFVCL